MKLQHGYYNIIPCLFSAGVEGTFELVVYCDKSFDFVSFDQSCKGRDYPLPPNPKRQTFTEY